MTAATASHQKPVSHHVAGRRVLVAEDSPTTHEILKLLLTQRGHHVDIATDGELALEALRRQYGEQGLVTIIDERKDKFGEDGGDTVRAYRSYGRMH